MSTVAPETPAAGSDRWGGGPTMSIPEAARLLRIGKNQAYEAAARGDLPAVRVGRRILVLTAPLRRMLQLDATPAAESRE